MAFDFNAALDLEQDGAHAPSLTSPFDLAPVKSALAQHDIEIDLMVQRAEALEVDGEGAQTLAVEMAGQAKKLNNTIEKVRKGFVEGPNEFVKSVNNLAKSFQARLTTIENGLKRKLSAYASQKELERRKQEETARKAQAEIQKRLDEEAKASGVEPVKIEAPVVPKADGPVRTAAGTAYQKKVWTFNVKDAQAVPREYLAVDERKIREAVRAGVRQIPGVDIFEETQTALRA